MTFGRDVIEEQAHPHSAVGGFEELINKQVPGEIGVQLKVLHINTPLGSLTQPQSCYECLDAVSEQIEARFPGMGGSN